MREILFRGKATSGLNAGEFVDGFFVKDFWLPARTGCGIIPNDRERGGYCEVYPETVGQFTGLTDKNGKKIFEGDVVRVGGENGWYSDFGCRWGEGNLEFELANKNESIGLGYFAPYELEVIGNIHDNPELLEG